MTDQSDGEISLLDIAVFLAENWIAIFVLPIILAGVAYFVSSQIESDYTASATIAFPQIPQREAVSLVETMMTEVSRQAERTSSSDGLDITAKAGSITLAATASTEDAALEIIRDSAASISEVAMQYIEGNQERINRIGGYAEKMEAAIASSDVDSINPQAIAAAANLRMQYDFETTDADQARVWAASLLDVAPDTRANGRSQWLYAVTTLFLSAALLGMACFLRSAWRAASVSDQSREKIRRIRAAFGLNEKTEKPTSSSP